MKKWNTLLASLRGYDVAVTKTEDEVVITDRANGSEMVVFDESYQQSEDPSDIFTNIVVSFSTQHRHLEDMAGAAEYAVQLLNDEVLPLEFYRDGQSGFGGDIERADLPRLTQAMLAERFWLSPEELAHYEYEIHSWSGRYDIPKTPVTSLQKQ